MTRKKHRLSVFPHKITPVLMAQDLRQLPGWQITDFDFPDVWNKCAGDGVKIAVLDSGAQLDHEDLKDNIVAGPNFVNRTELPVDRLGHGTHVTSIIVAENNDLGILGVAYKAKVIVIKILDDSGTGSIESAVNGIKWAVHNKVDIISMSFGCPQPIPQVYEAIQFAYRNNIPVFAAAGNAGKNTLYWPSNYQETISIASIDRNLKKSNFSNTSHNIDLYCPGNDILGAIPPDSYGILRGTSQACPFGAGIAALLLSYKRNYQTDLRLDTVEDYRHAIKQFCKAPSESHLMGSGFFDPKMFAEWMSSH